MTASPFTPSIEVLQGSGHSRPRRRTSGRRGTVGMALALSILALGGLANPAAATTIGVTMVPPIAFFKFLQAGIQDHLRSMPGVEAKFEFADAGEGAKQVGQVKAFIDQHVDAIIVLPADAASTAQITSLAQDAHIPLVYVNNGPREDWFAGRIALALPNDLVAGRVQMDKLAQLMGGKGRIAIIRGPSSHSAAALRTQGVKEVLATYPGISVVEEAAADWDRKIAQDLVAGWLAKGDQLDAIAANNDEMAIGAANALDAAHIPHGKILVGGVDATPDGLAAMQQNRMTVTLLQDAALEGSRALDDAVKLIRNEPAQQYDWVSFELVTSKTLPHFVSN